VKSEDVVGGFVATAGVSQYTRCSARGNVEGTKAAGSYIGGFSSNLTNAATITDCYSWGDVTLVQGDAGGFVATTAASLTNVYAVGAIGVAEGWGNFGGISVYTINSTFSACFWDTDTTGESDGIGSPQTGNTGAPVGHTTDWMQTQANYTDAGWDFDTVWEIEGSYSPPGITSTKIYFVTSFPYEIETGDRYCISGVPFSARCWPLQMPDVSEFNRWDMVGGAVKCRKLSGFTSNDNAYWRVSVYRGVKRVLEDVDMYIDVTQNPADSAGAINVDGIDLEPYIEQIAAGVTFELTDAEFNVNWTDSRTVVD
jgi:hypothetical protein